MLIIDSLSHAWSGQGGVLEMVDKQAATSRSNNSYTAWRNVTPEHNRLVDTILQCKMHVIVCMRSKTAYELQENERGKKERGGSHRYSVTAWNMSLQSFLISTVNAIMP